MKALEVMHLKRRKRYLIDRTMQFFFLRFVVLYVMTASVFFGYVAVRINAYSTDSIVLATTSVPGSKEASTDSNLARSLHDILAARDKEFMVAIIAAIAIITVGVSFLTIVFSNRVAGPVFRIAYALKEMQGGNYSVRVQLRKGDQLQSLAEDLNRFAAKLESAGK